MLAPEDRWRVAVPLRNLEFGPLQIILSRVSTIGARRAKLSAPGRRHERRLALVACDGGMRHCQGQAAALVGPGPPR
jgi:hypothetical protein